VNLSKNRLAAFGAAGALAAGSVLAGGVVSPAAAGSDTATYSCTIAGTAMPLQISGSMDVPSSAVEPGSSLTSLPTTLGVALPTTITGLLSTLGISSADGSVSDVSFPIGTSGQSLTSDELALPAPVPLSPTSTASLVGEGVSSGTAPSTPGEYDVLMPKSFTFVPSTTGLSPIPCTTTDPGILGQLTVAGDAPADEKESTTTRAKFLNTPLTTAKRPLIRVRVLQEDGDPAAGTVVVKKGKKVLKKVTLNDAGKKRFRIAKLARGEHRIVFRYKGDVDSLASKVVKTVRVRRA